MISPFYLDLTESEISQLERALGNILRSGTLILGPHTKQFEAEFAAYIGQKHAVALNSCTAALHLALEAIGLQAGQAVLVPTLTFAATAEVVRYQHAVPLLIDCDPVTFHIDLADAERKIEQLHAGNQILVQRFGREPKFTARQVGILQRRKGYTVCRSNRV